MLKCHELVLQQEVMKTKPKGDMRDLVTGTFSQTIEGYCISISSPLQTKSCKWLLNYAIYFMFDLFAGCIRVWSNNEHKWLKTVLLLCSVNSAKTH